MSPTERREIARMRRQRPPMARPALVRWPDDGGFYYADDSLNLTWKEVAKIAAGFIVLTAGLLTIIFGFAFVGTP